MKRPTWWQKQNKMKRGEKKTYNNSGVHGRAEQEVNNDRMSKEWNEPVFIHRGSKQLEMIRLTTGVTER